MASMRFAPWVVLLLVLPGCATLSKWTGVGSDDAAAPDAIRISYRTQSDRINLAAGGAVTTNQLVSTGGSGTLLPAISTSNLHIETPHPSGRPDLALATLHVTPGDRAVRDTSDLFRGDRETGQEQRLVLDIPAWQAEAVVKKLTEENFFRRAKVLGPKAFLGVQRGHRSLAKNYRAVPELDSLIIRVRREGRPAGQPQQPVTPPPSSTAAAPAHAPPMQAPVAQWPAGAQPQPRVAAIPQAPPHAAGPPQGQWPAHPNHAHPQQPAAPQYPTSGVQYPSTTPQAPALPPQQAPYQPPPAGQQYAPPQQPAGPTYPPASQAPASVSQWPPSGYGNQPISR